MAENEGSNRPSELTLFDLKSFEGPNTEPLISAPQLPVHTGQKARLIAEYLRLFVLVTKHGTYVDGFAGPQAPEAPDTWAARLVLETEPPWLRHFFLFDIDPRKAAALEALRAQHPPRKVVVRKGDFNVLIDDLLADQRLGEKEATFCLIDQRTFECDWMTVQKLATYKGGYKIELFYFLAQGWLDRAFAGQKDEERLNQWWGSPSWRDLLELRSWDRAAFVAERFRRELDYRSAKPWPIYGADEGGAVMYYMIHATDHLAAPGLMARAYDAAVGRAAPSQQYTLLP